MLKVHDSAYRTPFRQQSVLNLIAISLTSRDPHVSLWGRGREREDNEEESLEEANLYGDLAAGVGLIFVWIERRQQRELRGLDAVPVVAVPVHGHLPGAELREHVPAASGAGGRLAMVLVCGGGDREGRRGEQDDE